LISSWLPRDNLEICRLCCHHSPAKLVMFCARRKPQIKHRFRRINIRSCSEIYPIKTVRNAVTPDKH
ncbi:MAG: hypothetical protein ACU0BN_09085, partial [Sulfitobacter sp.]